MLQQTAASLHCTYLCISLPCIHASLLKDFRGNLVVGQSDLLRTEARRHTPHHDHLRLSIMGVLTCVETVAVEDSE